MVTVWHRIRKGVAGISETEWVLLGFETLGIVFGVLLAVQIGNWIDDRKEVREQGALIERLFEESRDVVTQLRGERDYFNGIEQRQAGILDRWVNQGECPDRSGWGALAVTRFFPGLNLPSAAYDEMIGSGGLGRLDDPELRQSVSRYHGSLAAYSSQQDFFRATSIARDGDRYWQFPVGIDGESGEVTMGESGYDALCAAPGAENTILASYRTASVMNDFRDGLTADAIRMCVKLGEAVGRACTPVDGEPLSDEDLAFASGDGER